MAADKAKPPTPTRLSRADRARLSLLRLGQLLHKHAHPRSELGLTRPLAQEEADRIKAEVEALEESIADQAADKANRALRSVLGMRGDERLNYMMLRCLSYVGYRALSISHSPTASEVASAASMGDLADLLEARHVLRHSIIGGESLVFSDTEFAEGVIRPGQRLVNFLSGERQLDVIWTAASIEEEKREFERRHGPSSRARPSRARNAPVAPGGTGPQPTSGSTPTSAREIYQRLRQTVIGMDDTVRQLTVQMSMHMSRVAVLRSGGRPTVPPTTVLLIGPSSSGKTFMAESFARQSQLAHATADCSMLSQSCYVGLNTDDCYTGLLTGGAKQPQQGVLILDEFDKIAAKSGWHSDVDPAGAGVQAELLRILEGTMLQIGGRRSNDCSRGTIDTYETCFVLAGAFEGLASVVRQMRKDIGGMGFQDRSGQGTGRADLRDAIIRYGFSPQIVNRIGAVIVLPEPSIEQLVQIAGHSNGVLGRTNRFLESYGFRIEPTRQAVLQMATWARETKSYSRGLKCILNALAGESIYGQRTGSLKVGVQDVRRAIESLDSSELLG